MFRITPDKIWLWAYGIVPTVILVFAAAAWFQAPQNLEDFRNIVFDNYQRLKPRERGADTPVRIVDIDEESLARLGQWPWPRTLLAKLVNRLAEAGTGVIVFDMVFAEPDRTSPRLIAGELPKTEEFRFFRDRLKTLPDHDGIFARALEGASVVVGFALTLQDNGLRPMRKAGYLFSSKLNDAAAKPTIEELALKEREGKNVALDIKKPEDYLPEYGGGAVINVPSLEKAASGNGSFAISRDRDGIIRRAPAMFKHHGTVYPSLWAEAARLAVGSRGYKVKAGGGSDSFDYGEGNGIVKINFGRLSVSEEETAGLDAPTDAEGNVLLYDTGYVPERFISAWRILDDNAWARADKSKLEGIVAFVGTSAAGLKDMRATPLNPQAAGVEVHAQIAEQIFLQEFLKRPLWADPLEFFYMVSLGLLLILLTSRLGAALSALVAAGGIVLSIGLSWRAFSAYRLLIDPIFPSLVVFAVYLSCALINYLRTESERRHIREAFGRYMSPDLVNQLAQDSSKLELGGEMRRMTLMFSDIRGFTTISEQFDAHGLTRFINAYLTPMTNIVLEHKGTIDKYMGDCIMAFWNAPLDDPDHARNACRAALAMRRRLIKLNESWAEEAQTQGRKYIPIHAGIGLNSGECCVGNMGSDLRQDYSVLGDEVNLASRLEGQSKSYGVEIVIGDNTRKLVPDFAAVELDLIRVKGKTVPVHIFTLLGDEAAGAEEKFRKMAARHAEMLSAYRSGNWDEVERAIDDLRYLGYPLDKLYDLYLDRVAACRKEPPGEDWDGVFTATTK